MLEIDKSMCCGCSACVNICPQQCISFVNDIEGFCYPHVEENICIHCGMCKKVCPFQVHGEEKKSIPKAYGMKALDNNILKNSSSGGVFTLLAEQIIEIDGVVYGAAMTDDMRGVRHIRVTSAEGLLLLRGSKYLQSQMNDCYNQVKEDLNSKNIVLFSGTPCQINGLKLYLGKNYENLICVEVICHGVPSPLLWENYINYLENKLGEKIIYVNFREKLYGWKKFGLLVKGENKSKFLSLDKDTYLQMFLKNYCLRPSCYNCNVKKSESMADITIADFWGAESIVPEMDDDKGTSLVLIQTSKGQNYLKMIKNLTVFRMVDFDKSIMSNPAYFNSTSKPFKRENFFDELNQYGYMKVAKKYGHLTLKEQLIRIISKTPVWETYMKLVHKM